MTGKFYLFVVILVLIGAGVAYIKVSAKIRAKRAHDELIEAMARAKREEEEAKRPKPAPQPAPSWMPQRKPSSARDLTEEELDRIMRGN